MYNWKINSISETNYSSNSIVTAPFETGVTNISVTVSNSLGSDSSSLLIQVEGSEGSGNKRKQKTKKKPKEISQVTHSRIVFWVICILISCTIGQLFTCVINSTVADFMHS